MQPELSGFFDGARLRDKSNLAASLVTVGEDGWPHAAMISVGELLVHPSGEARLATWSRSRTTANLRRTGQALLHAVIDAHAIRARLDVEPADDDGTLTLFIGRLAGVDEDIAPYAMLVSGTTFTLPEPDEVLARWEQTMARLRRL